MSSDITCILTKDSRISELSDKLKVSALIGSKDNSFYSYAATTASKNSVSVTCALPSESVVFDRLVFIGATVNFKITMTTAANAGPANGVKLFNYGQDCAFQAFPLNGLISNNNVKVNSVSFNMAQEDLQNVLLRTQDINELIKSNMVMSPSYSDNVAEYSAANGAFANSVFRGFQSNTYSSLLSRGVHPISNVTYLIDNAPVANQAAFVTANRAAAHTYVVNFSAKFFEPLLISPFVFSSQKMSKCGLTNVNRMTFNFTIDNLLKNAWSQLPIVDITSNAGGNSYKIELQDTPFNDFNVFINCLTPQITDIIPPITVLPCIQYERYTSSYGNQQVAIATNTPTDLTLNNLVLSQIPEMIYVVVRKVMSNTSSLDAKSFFSINSCSVNFMNAQGMLSNCNAELLWKLSKENGVSLDWYSWSGKANTTTDAGTYSNAFLTGSVLAINPAKDLSLNSPYVSNGSNGNYNLQLKLNVVHNYSAGVVPEIMIVCKNSCYLKNFPGGKSTLTQGYFDMETLANVVTKASEPVVGNADVSIAQKNISDQMIGDLNENNQDADINSKREVSGNGYHRGAGGRMGGSNAKRLNKILI